MKGRFQPGWLLGPGSSPEQTQRVWGADGSLFGKASAAAGWPSGSVWRPGHLRVDHIQVPLGRCAVTRLMVDARTQRLQPGWTGGNRVSLVTNGAAEFQRKLESVAKAHRVAWWSTYEFHGDAAGQACQQALAQASRNGACSVLVYDAWGANQVPQAGQSGARVVPFNPIRGRFAKWSIRRILNRNHQKIVVADDAAYVGGMNVGDGYAGGWSAESGLAYRDADVRVEGPAVRELQRVFVAALRANPLRCVAAEAEAEAALVRETRVPKRRIRGAHAYVRILHQATDYDERPLWWLSWRKAFAAPLPSITRELVAAIGKAQLCASFSSPYFLPPPPIARALVAAADRGVEVNLYVSGTTDLPAHLRASRHAYGPFLARGVRIFEYEGAEVMHAKMAVIDHAYCQVGSYNLDHWSRHNVEVALAAVDRPLALRVDREFDSIRACSKPVDYAGWLARHWSVRLYDWLCFFVYNNLTHPGVAYVPHWVSDVYEEEFDPRFIDPEWYSDPKIAADPLPLRKSVDSDLL